MTSPERATEKVSRKRQTEFIGGRLCARQCLRSFPIARLEVGVSADRAPVWPIGIVGSISHTTSFAFAAVASSTAIRSIGIDSEEIVTAIAAESIEQQCLTRGERAHLAASQTVGSVELHTLIFSAKEAVYKAVYPLIRRLFDFCDVEIDRLDFDVGSYHARFVNDEIFGRNGGFLGCGRFRFVSDVVHTSFEIV